MLFQNNKPHFHAITGYLNKRKGDFSRKNDKSSPATSSVLSRIFKKDVVYARQDFFLKRTSTYLNATFQHMSEFDCCAFEPLCKRNDTLNISTKGWLWQHGETTWTLDRKQNLKRQNNLLHDGLPVCNVSEHHALDDAVVLLLWQVLVWHQWSVILGGRGGVDPLQPGVALDLFQGSSSLWIPLEHPVYQTGQGEESREKRETILAKIHPKSSLLLKGSI